MGDELLTVLDRDAEGDGETDLGLDDDTLRRLYEHLLLVRTVDERVEELRARGRVGFFVPAGSHAAASLGAADALEDPDWLYPSYRDYPAWLRRGGSLRDLVAQLLGATGDPLGGRQLPGHLSLPDGRFVAVSGSLTGHLAQAVGSALVLARHERPNVVFAALGRLAGGRGAFATALAAATAHDAPVVFGWRGRGEDPAPLAAAHGVPVIRVDGSDVVAVRLAVRQARASAIEGSAPQLVVARLDADPGADPITRLRRFLERRGLWEADWQEDVERRSRDGFAEALGRAGGAPDPGSVLEDVTAEPTWMVLEQGERLAARRDED